MAYQQTIYSLHSCTSLGGCTSVILFDDFEKLMAKIPQLYCQAHPYKEWVATINDTLFSKSKGQYTFDLPYEDDEGDDNDKIFITIATLPI